MNGAGQAVSALSADERDMLADLTFAECAACFGTGITATSLYCVACSGEGVIPEWNYL